MNDLLNYHYEAIYRVSHKKRNDGFSVACDLKVPYLSHLQIKQLLQKRMIPRSLNLI